MWLPRQTKKTSFIKQLLGLKDQVLILRGARQVGKTSFILNAFEDLSRHPQLRLNLLFPSSFKLSGKEYFGRDFFGSNPTGEELLKNIERVVGNLKSLKEPALVFVDEVDRHPLVLESIQTLAEFSDKLKFVFTGSNLENIPVHNAATGRKKYFDLYPITFIEFIAAGADDKLVSYLREVSLKNYSHSDFFHHQARDLFATYLKLGGMPKILDTHLDPENASATVPDAIKDLAVSVEENIKTVLGEKAKLYEYEDVLRTMASLSMNTLKFNRLQVQHAGRSEAKKLVSKTVGARVAHKIRLFSAERDLSKYILFDCGIANYLLNGADLLRTTISDHNFAVLHETFVGNELIADMVTRDDLLYWKSGNVAEADYLLRAPRFIGIDVKVKGGDIKSLNSLALFEKDLSSIVKITAGTPSINREHVAGLPNYDKKRKISLVTIPHYLTFRLFELLDEAG